MRISDGMHHIVEDIANSRTGRIADIAGLNNEVGEIRSDTRKTLRTLNSTRKRDAGIMRQTLKNVVMDNQKVVQGLTHDAQDMLVDFGAQRLCVKKDVAEAHGIWQSHVHHGHPGARPGLKTVHKETNKPHQKQKSTGTARVGISKKKSSK